MKRKTIYCISTGQIFESMAEAAEDAGVGKPAMSLHLKDPKRKSCGGKIYMIIEPEQTEEEIKAKARERIAQIIGNIVI